jgi:hypothetical protein
MSHTLSLLDLRSGCLASSIEVYRNTFPCLLQVGYAGTNARSVLKRVVKNSDQFGQQATLSICIINNYDKIFCITQVAAVDVFDSSLILPNLDK